MSGFNHALLKQRREELKLSRRDVIIRMHDLGYEVSEGTISNWEDEQSTPDADALPLLCKIFGGKLTEWLS